MVIENSEQKITGASTVCFVFKHYLLQYTVYMLVPNYLWLSYIGKQTNATLQCTSGSCFII